MTFLKIFIKIKLSEIHPLYFYKNAVCPILLTSQLPGVPIQLEGAIGVDELLVQRVIGVRARVNVHNAHFGR
jgi:hypothetical protein